MFHTYAYATENYLCYAPSLHNVCVRATKNDTRIFDFERFMADYSRIIYPLFLWYAYSAQQESEHIFTLADFRASVRLNFLEIEHNGLRTLAWLRRNVARRDQALRERHAEMIEPKRAFAEKLFRRGVTPENTYLFMHGHTLMDNVVIVLLNTVCEKLRELSIAKITASSKKGGGAQKTRCPTTPIRCDRSATCCSTTKTIPIASCSAVCSATSNGIC